MEKTLVLQMENKPSTMPGKRQKILDIHGKRKIIWEDAPYAGFTPEEMRKHMSSNPQTKNIAARAAAVKESGKGPPPAKGQFQSDWDAIPQADRHIWYKMVAKVKKDNDANFADVSVVESYVKKYKKKHLRDNVKRSSQRKKVKKVHSKKNPPE